MKKFCVSLVVLMRTLQVVAQCLPPPATVPIEPDGTISYPMVEFEWQVVPQAVWYQLWVNRNGVTYHRQWFMGDTDWRPEIPLEDGTYNWWVQTWSPCGDGPWSSKATFTLAGSPPAAPFLFSPPDGGGGYPHALEMACRFEWSCVTPSTWAQIAIEKDGGAYYSQWFGLSPLDQLHSWVPPLTLRFPPATYQWCIRHYSPCGGTGPWSPKRTLESHPYPYAPTKIPGLTADKMFAPLAGTGSGWEDSSRRPKLSWNESFPSSWYQVEILRNSASYLTFWTHNEETWRPSYNLPSGNYSYRVRGWNDVYGHGPWSDPCAFSLSPITKPAIPPRPNYDAEGLAYGANRSCLYWEPLPRVCWYQVWIGRGGTCVYNGWHEVDLDDGGRDQSMFGYRRCQIRFHPPVQDTPGTYSAWIRTWTKPAGLSLWSSPCEVTRDFPMLKPLPISPGGVTTDRTPRFEWLPVNHVEDYTLWINREGKKYFSSRLGDVCRSRAYTEAEYANTFAIVGTKKGWRAGDACYGPLNFQFAFPFFGRTYTRCYVSTKGVICFDVPRIDHVPSVAKLKAHPMIAVLWNDYATNIESYHDIFVADDASYVTILWYGTHCSENCDLLTSVTLLSNGIIRMKYGVGNECGGLIGVSAGENCQFIARDEMGTLMHNAKDIVFTPTGNYNLSAELFWEFPTGDYTWWLRPHNGSNGDGPWSDGRTFSIQ